MGIYGFKFSDMIPNAWFYKLKIVSKTRNQNDTRNPTNQNYQPKTKSSSIVAAAPPQSHPLCYQRKSYHFTRDLPVHPQTDPNINISAPHFSEPPRKSTKTRLSTKKIRPSNGSSPRLLRASSIYANCSCSSEDDDDDDHFPELGSESGEESFDKMVSWSNSCHPRVKSNILFDTNNNPKFKKHSGFDSVSQFNLPPIITKTYKSDKNEAATKFRRRSAKIEEMSSYITSNSSKEQRINSPFRKLSVKPPGVKLRTKSPRIVSKSFLQVHGRKSVSSGKGGGGRRSLSEIFAVVKSSKDPYRDFKESMVDMIMENSMRTSQDLEDLLACYLSLNSDTYHDLIIKAFKQIWSEITDIRLK